MPVLLRDLAFIVTKTTQVLLLPTNYPRLFAGKIDVQNMVSGDLLTLEQRTKYSGADSFQLDKSRTFEFDAKDKTVRITPIREDDEIRWNIFLEAASPSTTVTVKVLITEEVVV